MNWLVTGATGYIGQHVAQQLLLNNFKIIGLDLNALPKNSPLIDKFPIKIGDICNENFIAGIFESDSIEGIINLAALKSVEESIEKPEMYEKVNLLGVKNLLRAANIFGTKYLIQSSTAAVYGSSDDGFVDEKSPTDPISPYGLFKLKAEMAISDSVNEGAIRATSLRYFNVIGSAHKTMKDKSTANIIPKVLTSLSEGQSPKIFGDDYLTPDRTCVRDYVHVLDIARAHVLAAQKIQEHELPAAINVGTGRGYSVREIMEEIFRQKGARLEPEIGPRRHGDPAMLVAKVNLAEEVLGFRAEKALPEMISSAI